MLKKALIIAAVVLAPVALSQSVNAQEVEVPRQITICHSRQPQPSNGQGGGAQGNPYGPQAQTVNINAFFNSGHDGHDGPLYNNTDQDYWGDIIPSFYYYDDEEQLVMFPGVNWSTEGQAIWNNNCQFTTPEDPEEPENPEEEEEEGEVLGSQSSDADDVSAMPETSAGTTAAIVAVTIAGVAVLATAGKAVLGKFGR